MVEHYDRPDLLELYTALEQGMDERKGIKPNLDYPAGPTYHLMGFDTETFTPLFVASRVTGWTAHIMEQLASNALIRPLSVYNGPTSGTFRQGARRRGPIAYRGGASRNAQRGAAASGLAVPTRQRWTIDDDSGIQSWTMHMLFRTLLHVLFLSRRKPDLGHDDVARTRFITLPTDLDINRHMNNGVYFSIMDVARFDMLVRNGVFGRRCATRAGIRWSRARPSRSASR